MIPLLFVALGWVLILLEFYLPGAVLGILGGLSVLAGIILFVSEAHSVWTILLFIIGSLASVALLVRFAIWRIVRAKSDHSIYSDANQEGFQASSYDKAAIGKEGVVIADLKPGGFIEIDGNAQAAISQGGYLSRGTRVLVIGGQEQSLMVIKKGDQS